MFKEASKEGFAVINDEIIEHITQMEPWIVCRIKNELNNDIYGYIVVEAIDYERLNENNFQYIRLVARWLEVNLRNAWNYELEFEKENKNPDGTWKMKTFKRIFEIETERYEQYGIPFQRISIESEKDIGNDIVSLTRSFDYVFKELKNGAYTYEVVLTKKKKNGWEQVNKRLTDKIEYFQSNIKEMASFEN